MVPSKGLIVCDRDKKEYGDMYKNRRSKKNRLLVIFIVLLLVLLTACGEKEEKNKESNKHYTIGIINLTPSLEPVIDGFKSQIAELGYVEGKNLTYIYDGPPASIAELDGYAQKLVDADVDLIFSVSTPPTQAVQRATTNKPIPCIFSAVQDPIMSGIVPSLTKPGANLTGITFGPGEGKRLEWLVRVAPSVKRVYIPYNVDDPAPNAALVLVSEVADRLGVELVLQPARNTEEVTTAIENIPDDVDALMILPDSIVAQSMDDLVRAAIEHKLPLTVALSNNVSKGALMSYGMQAVPIGKQAARLADHILKGSKPADLPIEVSEFFLAINLQTAEAIDLEVSDDILQQATIVIQVEGS
jgi:putative ABC transport system substrate-binding protein